MTDADPCRWALSPTVEAALFSDVLTAAGEQDLADGVLARHQDIRRRAAEQDRAAFEAARAAASVARG